MEWKKIARMEQRKIVFHSIPCPASNARLLFTKSTIPVSFLLLPIAQWKENHDYQTAKAFRASLAVKNDHIERSASANQMPLCKPFPDT